MLSKVSMPDKFKQNSVYLKKMKSYLVTLNILRRRRALRTERPNEPACGTRLVQMTSKTLAKITMQSKRLKVDSK